MYPRYKICLLVLLCTLFLFQTRVSTAAEARTISPQQWQQLTSDKTFGYKNEVEKQIKKPDTTPGPIMRALEKIIEFFGGAAFRVVFWTILALVVIYVVYRLVLSNEIIFFSRKKKALTGDADGELGDIEGTDWDALLQKAVSSNDLQQAVRYSYMWLLQMLEDSRLISYRDDKTNFEYYRELENTAYKQSFKQISRQYEYVNYGKYSLSPADYNTYINLFNNVKKQLGR